jgi:hypothetical protein
MSALLAAVHAEMQALFCRLDAQSQTPLYWDVRADPVGTRSEPVTVGPARITLYRYWPDGRASLLCMACDVGWRARWDEAAEPPERVQCWVCGSVQSFGFLTALHRELDDLALRGVYTTDGPLNCVG